MAVRATLAVVLVTALLAFAQLAAAADCPDGSNFVKCLDQPCARVRCASGYTCKDDYCGGCTATCVKVEDNNTDVPVPVEKPAPETTCADGSKPVQCLVDPCTFTTCLTGTVRRPSHRVEVQWPCCVRAVQLVTERSCTA